MPVNTTHPFIGPCEICGKVSRNYNALGLHLSDKRDLDSEHRSLRERWMAWRSEYRANLYCRKCGDLFEVFDVSLKDSKRCPKCEHLRRTLGKRKYEALKFDVKPDLRLRNGDNSKSRWPVGYKPEVDFADCAQEIENVLRRGGGIREVVQLGVCYRKAREILEQMLGGPEAYDQWVLKRKIDVAHLNREQARTGSRLEETFVDQMLDKGFAPCGRNVWITLEVEGQKVHRELDIRVNTSSGRKVIVLCDGIVYHGPGCLYTDPEKKTADDIATAESLYSLGYTVLRYSETEILSGQAIQHFQAVMQSEKHTLRHWFGTS